MRVSASLLLLLGLASCAGQQDGPPSETTSGPPPVVAVRSVTPASVPAGDTVEVSLTFEIAEGFHIQANPASQPYLIPALLELEATEGLTPGPPDYPPGEPYRIEGADDDLSTYGGTLTINVPVSASPDARTGERSLLGTFRYQACNERHCLAPTTLGVKSSFYVR